MSFKYRFILSFVLLEIFFILLIVSVNFIAINNSSKALIKDKIKSNMTFMEQLVKVPLSIYDIATLDDLLEKIDELKYIDSVLILDKQEKILSKEYNFEHKTIKELLELKKDESISIEKNRYEIRYKELFEEEVFLGSLYIVFDITENSLFIEENRTRTILIVIFEIIISTFLSYIIGNRLTMMLTNLTKVSEEIAHMKDIDIPYQDKKDEIGILAKSMYAMSKQINESYTNLKQLTIIQDRQKKDLEEANRSKDDFLANMSHELKTPLNSINVISSVMMKNKDQSLNEKQVKNLNIINQCGNDLLFLINDVLDISKLEAGQMKLNYETFNLKETIEEIQNMFKPQTKEKGINFIVEYNMSTNFIYSDKQRLKQIVKNLLSNSIKFVNRDSGIIKLLIIEDKKNFKIDVEDNGVGIANEKLEKIFDRFKQEDSSTTRKFGGTGLGLSICKELCTLLEGEISVQSVQNSKTTFSISLPKNSSNVSKRKEKNSETPKVNQSEDIIILNSDPIALMNLVITLKNQFNVEQVNTLVDLIKKEKEKNSFLLIIDVKDIKSEELEKLINILGDKIVLISYDDISIYKNRVKLTVNKPIESKKVLEKIVNLKGKI